jgi:hypothetical protein
MVDFGVMIIPSASRWGSGPLSQMVVAIKTKTSNTIEMREIKPG